MTAALFFDVETTGLLRRELPPEHPAQPRVVQLAWLLASGPERALATSSFIIKPDGWTVPEESSRIHGIDHATAERVGAPITFALECFRLAARIASCVVAHNLDFDGSMLRAEVRRAGLPPLLHHDTEARCTLKENIDVVRAPFPEGKRSYPDGRGRNGQWKFPTLAETHEHYFGVGFDGAHDALADVQACARIFWAMEERKKAAVTS